MAKRMIWSIYKDTDGEFDTWEENPVAFFFNRDIDASPDNRVKFFKDGIHEVFFGDHSTFLEVVDGKFDIDKVKVLIGNIVEADGYWGEFIEGFSKYKGKYVVEIGS